jgi:hypothetical protein
VNRTDSRADDDGEDEDGEVGSRRADGGADGDGDAGTDGARPESGTDSGSGASRSRPCPLCGAGMARRHCKYVCPNHGVVYDCSDTFW